MDIGPLRSFLILAREGHMTRAAAELHLTQPAVSAQLARLEDELGQPLFHRTSKGMVLTEAGRLFRDYVEQALMRLDDGVEAVGQLAGLERGTLAIGGGATATTYLFPPLLGRFHSDFPAIRMYVREVGSRGVVQAVLSGDLDVGVVTLPVEGTEARTLDVEPWLGDELLLITPPGHRLQGRRTFRWRDLDGDQLVLFEGGTAVRNLIDGRIADAGIQVEIVMELRSIESIKQMVAQGIGAAFVSRFALPRPDAGLRCAEGRLERQLGFITRSDRAPSPASEAFLQLMREADPFGDRAGDRA